MKLLENSQNVLNLINIDINIDGLPIFKDGKENNFWLVLGRAPQISKLIFVIGLYQGTKKPENFNDFLKPLVEEYKKLQEEPLEFEGKQYIVKIRLFTLDAPARCAVLATHYYNWINGCPRCDIKGLYLKHRMCFPGPQGNRRTNKSFRDKSQPEYHLGNTILEEISEIDLVDDFALDYLHVVLLGVVRKFLIITF